ncbi:MAG: hypothetical protein LBM93_08335 [Oscillospiraceae bacterium]|jgi:hypothetical protein|nr:hypothetical protein [Oscillospiraceae bacterium]
MNEKKENQIRGILTVFLVAIMVSAVIIIFTLVLGNENVQETETVADAAVISQVYQTEATVITKPIGYVMKDYDGVVAIFRENSELPYQILDYPMYLLSDEDKMAVEEGITVETEQEMKRLIEDMCE